MNTQTTLVDVKDTGATVRAILADADKPVVTPDELKRLKEIMAKTKPYVAKMEEIGHDQLRIHMERRLDGLRRDPNAPVKSKKDVEADLAERRKAMKQICSDIIREAGPIVEAIRARVRDAINGVADRLEQEERVACSKYLLKFDPSTGVIQLRTLAAAFGQSGPILGVNWTPRESLRGIVDL